LISIRVRAKATSSFSQFVIGGGTFPIILIFFTQFATIMGVGNFVGHAAKGYDLGLPHLAFILGEQGSKIIFALVFAGLAGRLTYNTLSELIDDLLVRDKVTRLLVGLIASSIMIAWVGGQGKGISVLFHTITGANEIFIILLFSAIFILYTTLGGIHSVVWTDLFQGIMVLIFGAVFYFFAFKPVGFSINRLSAKLAEVGAKDMWSFASVDFLVMVTKFVTGVIGILAAQVYWQRCFSARDSKTARNGLLYSGIIAIIMVMLTALVGIVIKALNPSLEPAQAIAWFLLNHIPPFVAAAIFALILAAGMSSADSYLNSAATLIVNDLVIPFKKEADDKWLVKLTVILTVIIGIFAALAAIWASSIIGMFEKAYSFAGGAIVPLLVVGLIWKKKTGEKFQMGIKNSNVTPWGARTGILVGGTMTQIGALGAYRNLIALFVSAALVVIVSLLTAEKTAASG